ncbi:MAG: oxidoreductase, partial [Microbacterium sp.]|nr:oxidoreductase [Microbacterium sp.]
MTTDTAARTDEPATVRRPRGWFWASLAGLVSAAALLAVAELFAVLVARSASPVLAVGSFIVDIVPRPLKELAITVFGESDKIALLAGVGLGAAVAAAVAGVLEYRFRPVGAILLGVGGALATAAIVTRAGATALAWLPPVLGT